MTLEENNNVRKCFIVMYLHILVVEGRDGCLLISFTFDIDENRGFRKMMIK